MKTKKLLAAAAIAGLVGWMPAQATIITVVGTSFDLRYDDTKLGLFGAPTLVGDQMFFTLSNFVAQSNNGAGVVSTFSTVSGLELVAKNGTRFTGLMLSEFGDYNLSGTNSTVQVLGQLRAFNTANALSTQTSSNLVVSAATPLNLADGANHDWLASAAIDATTPVLPVPGFTNVIASSPEVMGLLIENRLSAYTDPAQSGLLQAFIEKKVAGVAVTVSVVPEPETWLTFLLGLGLVGARLHRRC